MTSPIWVVRGLGALALGVLVSTNTAVLRVSRERPEDEAVILATDQRKTYTARQVETAALQPYCLAIVAEGGGGPAQRVWPPNAPRECFSEGYAVHAIPAAPPVLGGPGRSVAAVVSLPFADDNTPNTVLVRFTLEAVITPQPDGGGP